MLTPGQNPFSPTVSDSPAGNVDTGRCCPHWELRGMFSPTLQSGWAQSRRTSSVGGTVHANISDVKR